VRVRGIAFRDVDDAYDHFEQRELDDAMLPEIAFDESTHTYTVDGRRFPSVTEVVGMLRPESSAREDVLEYKRKLGKAVHKAIELMEAGTLDPDSLDPAIVPFVDAWRKFKTETEFSVLHSEMIVVSKKLRVAGTLDLTGMRSKYIELLDLKAVWAMGDETAIQTAGYSILYEEMTGVKVDMRGGLQLLRDGTYRYHPYKDANDRNVFLACLSVHNWKALHQ
jgi:hypothetical protein